jgi:hypothetical protein
MFCQRFSNNDMIKNIHKIVLKLRLFIWAFWILLINLQVAKAQWATVSSGGVDTVGGLIISSSLGEWDVQTLDYPGGQIQWGVQQPYRMPLWLQTRLSGSLLYGNAAATPLVGTEVQLRQGSQLLASAFTTAGGQFDFGMVDTGQYQLTYQNPTPWRGVNATDALGVLRHFTNGILLQGLYRQAADVNARNLINAMEAQSIARRTIRLLNQFAAGDWLYDRYGLSIAAQANAQNPSMVVPITALCYGDVNGSYNPGAPLRTRWVPVEPRGVMSAGEADEVYEWPIHWLEGGNVGAITLEMQVPEGVEVDQVVVGQSRVGGESLFYHQTDDVLRVAWYGLNPWEVEPGGELIRLKVRGVPRAPWQYGSESEMADGWARPISGFRLSMPQCSSSGLEARVLPNPMGEWGRLWCSVPGLGEVSYRLIDAFGRMVWTGAADVNRASVFEVALPAERMRQGAYQLQLVWQGTSGESEYRTIKIVKN